MQLKTLPVPLVLRGQVRQVAEIHRHGAKPIWARGKAKGLDEDLVVLRELMVTIELVGDAYHSAVVVDPDHVAGIQPVAVKHGGVEEQRLDLRTASLEPCSVGPVTWHKELRSAWTWSPLAWRVSA